MSFDFRLTRIASETSAQDASAPRSRRTRPLTRTHIDYRFGNRFLKRSLNTLPRPKKR
jgi:hypothetical protein